MRLIDRINDYILNPYTVSDRARFSHYPSEASVISRADGNVIGKCHRASFYSWKGVKSTNPVDARGQWTFNFGNSLEDMYIEYTKQLGIWAGNNIKFYDRANNISGEVDLFIFDKKEQILGTSDSDINSHYIPTIGVELKSAYGYGFQSSVKNFPKIENLLQVALYMAHFKAKEWLLIYHSRDTMENVEYHIEMSDCNEEGKEQYLIVNSIPCRLFYIEDIYKRYQQLGEYVITDKEPPKDYTYGYTAQQTAERVTKGIVKKTKYAAIKAGKATDSSWQCLYCNYLDRCWAEKRGIIKDKIDIKEDLDE